MSARNRTIPAALAAAALAVVLAGCGSSGDGSGGGGAGASSAPAVPAAAKDDALAAKVPASVSADGKLVFGTDASYPPNEFTDTDGRTIIGMDVDLGTAIAQKLGLQAEFQNSQFSGIIPGIDGARYEAGMSSFSITPERTATVDMVSYFTAGTSLAVKAGNPDGLNPDDLCGKAIGVQAGTTQAEEVVTRSQECTSQGKPAIQVTELQQQTDVTLALTSSRIVGMLADSPVAAYAVTTTNKAVEVVGEPYDTAPYGVVLKKGQAEFPQAVQGAIQALMDDGTYKAILDKWNVGNGAIPTSQINA
ncbi:ABC transporter substrate-binding protein [Pseudonocardia halophobica]|uniref:ABC transporter substrate-binding protein n=1 Tax=Pseudonocardia halophobica TaxID=29401 RepID=A0A9W6KW68_9PSEU|nr:ABC transporter substrate-binding protein [Pseudonocardia halophobica]GLL09151.1 ABC transporter substrate-binding protein [Pseudonocardia halophobica]